MYPYPENTKKDISHLHKDMIKISVLPVYGLVYIHKERKQRAIYKEKQNHKAKSQDKNKKRYPWPEPSSDYSVNSDHRGGDKKACKNNDAVNQKNALLCDKSVINYISKSCLNQINIC